MASGEYELWVYTDSEPYPQMPAEFASSVPDALEKRNRITSNIPPCENPRVEMREVQP